MSKTIVILSLLVVALSVAPATAWAASAEATPSAPGNLDVQVWPGAMPGQGVAIMSLTLPEETPLPARVAIPIFAGSTVDWAGEIGSQAADDVQRPATVETGTAGPYVVMELQKSRTAQVEVSGLPLESSAAGYSLDVEFVQTAPSPITGFSVRLPTGVVEAKITPAPSGDAQKNQAGESLYTLPSAELKVGDSVPISISYRLGTAPAPSVPAGGSSSSWVIVALVAGLVAALAVLVVAIRRERS